MDKKINEIWVNFSHFLGNGKSQYGFNKKGTLTDAFQPLFLTFS